MGKILTIIGISFIPLVAANAAVLLGDWNFFTRIDAADHSGSLAVFAFSGNALDPIEGRGADWDTDFQDDEATSITRENISAADSAVSFSNIPEVRELGATASDCAEELSGKLTGLSDDSHSEAVLTRGFCQKQMDSGSSPAGAGNTPWDSLSLFSWNGTVALRNLAAETEVAFQSMTLGAKNTMAVPYFRDWGGRISSDAFVNRAALEVPRGRTWLLVGVGMSFMLWNLRRRRRFEI